MPIAVTVETLARALYNERVAAREIADLIPWEYISEHARTTYLTMASQLLKKFHITGMAEDLSSICTHVAHIQVYADEPAGPVSLRAGITNLLRGLISVLERDLSAPAPRICGYTTETQGRVECHIAPQHEWNTPKAREIQAAEGQRNEVKPE